MSKFFNSLQVPTNPAYDFEGDPGDQPDYANPVVLSNKLVLHANAVIELTQAITTLSKKRERLRLEMRDAERKLQDMRRNVLSRYPAPPSAAKNLALTDAYIFKCVETDSLQDAWHALETIVAEREDQIETLKQQEEDYKYTVHTIKMASENITNRLSYTKHEALMSRHGI